MTELADTSTTGRANEDWHQAHVDLLTRLIGGSTPGGMDHLPKGTAGNQRDIEDTFVPNTTWAMSRPSLASKDNLTTHGWSTEQRLDPHPRVNGYSTAVLCFHGDGPSGELHLIKFKLRKTLFLSACLEDHVSIIDVIKNYKKNNMRTGKTHTIF